MTRRRSLWHPSAATRAVPTPSGGGDGITSGILFPSNGDGSVSNVVFRFSGADMPNIVPLTILFKIAPIQQTGFHTTFFHGQTNGAFSGGNDYFGAHPYPQGGSSGTVHNWELSINGVDDITDENANSTVVTKGTALSPVWYSQAIAAQNSAGNMDVDYWWDLRTSTNRRINAHPPGFQLVNSVNSPGLQFGDAAWGANNERLSGILRGLQIYQGLPGIAHILELDAREDDASVLAYLAANSITPWYVNMNLTPSDISDKSGAGHDPAWIDSDIGELWEP